MTNTKLPARGPAEKAELELKPLTKEGSPAIAPPPLAPPPFSKGDIYAAIPPHCFERNTLKSLMHVAIDLAMVAALGAAATQIYRLPLGLQLLAWPAYWYAAGSVMTGIWVLAHECGHGAFSASALVNDVVGWTLHSSLLVPYFSWKYTHATHHRNTCSIENDEVFVPATRSDFAAEMIRETPLASALGIFSMLTFGWPGYIMFNAAGPAKYRTAAHKSHFNPASALFTDKQRPYVVISDVGFFLALAGVGAAVHTFGAANVLCYYFIPYLIVNLHLVLITYLQHTDSYIPHYREGEFTWLRGALSTVDRNYSWILNAAFHHIGDTHVVHHLFHQMPWYHAQEATEAVKKVLGQYYLSDPTPIPTALWRSWRQCRFVEDDGDIVFLKNADAFEKDRKPKRA